MVAEGHPEEKDEVPEIRTGKENEKCSQSNGLWCEEPYD